MNILHRVRNMVGIGVTRLFYPKRALQEVQMDMRSGETRDELEHVMPYGFAHLPHTQSEGVAVFPGGDRGFGLVISVYDRRYRMKLEKAGEVALFDDLGQTVHLTRDGILIQSAQQLTIETPKTTITGDVDIKGECTIKGVKHSVHTHPESIGSNTGKPS